ncbi:hypothetical protein BKA81DRAFT_375746 [Phyllosticta paracitricarpa]
MAPAFAADRSHQATQDLTTAVRLLQQQSVWMPAPSPGSLAARREKGTWTDRQLLWLAYMDRLGTQIPRLIRYNLCLGEPAALDAPGACRDRAAPFDVQGRRARLSTKFRRAAQGEAFKCHGCRALQQPRADDDGGCDAVVIDRDWALLDGVELAGSLKCRVNHN